MPIHCGPGSELLQLTDPQIDARFENSRIECRVAYVVDAPGPGMEAQGFPINAIGQVFRFKLRRLHRLDGVPGKLDSLFTAEQIQ